jgi:hypothetical protein
MRPLRSMTGRPLLQPVMAVVATKLSGVSMVTRCRASSNERGKAHGISFRTSAERAYVPEDGVIGACTVPVAS